MYIVFLGIIPFIAFIIILFYFIIGKYGSCLQFWRNLLRSKKGVPTISERMSQQEKLNTTQSTSSKFSSHISSLALNSGNRNSGFKSPPTFSTFFKEISFIRPNFSYTEVIKAGPIQATNQTNEAQYINVMENNHNTDATKGHVEEYNLKIPIRQQKHPEDNAALRVSIAKTFLTHTNEKSENQSNKKTGTKPAPINYQDFAKRKNKLVATPTVSQRKQIETEESFKSGTHLSKPSRFALPIPKSVLKKSNEEPDIQSNRKIPTKDEPINHQDFAKRKKKLIVTPPTVTQRKQIESEESLKSGQKFNAAISYLDFAKRKNKLVTPPPTLSQQKQMELVESLKSGKNLSSPSRFVPPLPPSFLKSTNEEPKTQINRKLPTNNEPMNYENFAKRKNKLAITPFSPIRQQTQTDSVETGRSGKSFSSRPPGSSIPPEKPSIKEIINKFNRN